MINSFQTDFETRERKTQQEQLYTGEAVDLVATLTRDGVPLSLTGCTVRGIYQPASQRNSGDWYEVPAEIVNNRVVVHWSADYEGGGNSKYLVWALVEGSGNDVAYPCSWMLSMAYSPSYPVGELHPIPHTIDFSQYELLNAPWALEADLGTAAYKDVPASGNAGTGQVVMGNDSRLTDSRTPTNHAASHRTGGTDPITPESIGAATVSALAGKLDKSGGTMTGSIDFTDNNGIGVGNVTIRSTTNNEVEYYNGGAGFHIRLINGKALYAATLEDIAQNFSNQTSYTVGQLVVYEGKLYRCTTAHTGAWNASHFTEATVEDALAGKASTADATLTDVWVFADGLLEAARSWTATTTTHLEIRENTVNLVDRNGDVVTNLATVSFSSDGRTAIMESGFPVALYVVPVGGTVATKTAYQLGSQSDKLLAPAEGLAEVTEKEAQDRQSIADLGTTVAGHTTQIATNTAGIATNATNIATNTAGIATNTAAISALDEEFSEYQIKAALNDPAMALPVTVVEWEDGEIQTFDITGAFKNAQATTINDARSSNVKKICFGTKINDVDVNSCYQSGDTGYSRNTAGLQKATVPWEHFCSCEKFLIPTSVLQFQFGFGETDPNNACVDVQLPSTLTTIRYGGFLGWKGLTRIDIPDTVTSIGIYAFKDLPGLAEINFGNTRTDGLPFNGSVTWRISGRTVTRVATLGTTTPKIVVPTAVYGDWVDSCISYRQIFRSYLMAFGDWTSAHEYELVDFLETGEFDDEAYLTKTAQGDIDTSVVSWTDVGNKLNSVLAILKRETNATTYMTYLNQTTAKMYVRGTLNLFDIPDYTNMTELKVGTAVKSLQGSPTMSNLSSVILQEGLQKIHSNTLSYASHLTSINIPNSVVEIGSFALPSVFTGFDKTTIPGCALLDGWMFYFVDYPGSEATTLDLTGIKGMTTHSLLHFGSLRSLVIPASMVYIAPDFKYDTASASVLDSISVASGNTVYDSRDNCNAVIRTADNTLVVGTTTTAIPNNVTAIGERAFYGRPLPASATYTIPSGVHEIGVQAFAYTTGPDAFDITGEGSKGVHVCENAFASSSVSAITLNSVMSATVKLDANALSNLSNLQTVTLNGSSFNIHANAFSYSSNITSVTFTSKTISQVQGIRNYPWGLPTECVIHCSDGDITI